MTSSTKYVTVSVSGVSFTLPSYYSDPKMVASGSYGCVCKAVDTRTGNEVAIKKVGWIHKNVTGNEYWRKLLREIRLMVHFDRHDNLLNLSDLIMPASCNYDALYLVSKFIKTDLNTLLSRCPAHFTPDNTFSMMYSMLSGLFAMHSAGVMHRDLKPSNILVDSDGTVKLADFGLGRDVPQSTADELSNYVVTRWYRAPEVLLGERYGMVVDVWSLGCIFAELLAAGSGVTHRVSQTLFPSKAQFRASGTGTKEQILMLLDFLGHKPGTDDAWIQASVPRDWLRKQSLREPIDLSAKYPKASPESLDLLRSMLTWNPNKRPTVKLCFRHAYLGEYQWSEGNEDQPWPAFDGSFTKKCVTEDDARRLANLEVTRFHRSFVNLPGVEIMHGVSLKTATDNAEDQDCFVESDKSVSDYFDPTQK